MQMKNNTIPDLFYRYSLTVMLNHIREEREFTLRFFGERSNNYIVQFNKFGGLDLVKQKEGV